MVVLLGGQPRGRSLHLRVNRVHDGLARAVCGVVSRGRRGAGAHDRSEHLEQVRSIGWWSREKPWLGSLAITSSVVRLLTPISASETLGEMSTRRPRQSSVSSVDGLTPPQLARAGSTTLSQKAFVLEWEATRKQRHDFFERASRKVARRKIVVSAPSEEGPAEAAAIIAVAVAAETERPPGPLREQ